VSEKQAVLPPWDVTSEDIASVSRNFPPLRGRTAARGLAMRERQLLTLLQSLAEAEIEVVDGKVIKGQTRNDGIYAASQKILWQSRIAGDENVIRMQNSVVNECYQAVISMLPVKPTDSTKEGSHD
jgi:hypothetical protein